MHEPKGYFYHSTKYEDRWRWSIPAHTLSVYQHQIIYLVLALKVCVVLCVCVCAFFLCFVLVYVGVGVGVGVGGCVGWWGGCIPVLSDKNKVVPFAIILFTEGPSQYAYTGILL